MKPITYTPKLSLIYCPAGPEGELSELAANLYTGCGFECTHCFVPDYLHVPKNKFHTKVEPKSDVLRKLKKDCVRMQEAGDKRAVLLCLTCDPYQPKEKVSMVTRQAIKTMNENKIRYKILSKAGMFSTRDFDLVLMQPQLCAYGAPLEYSKDCDSIQYEPSTAPTGERIQALWKAHKMGLKTYAIIETLCNYDDTVELLVLISGFVDKIYIGRQNYPAGIKDVDLSEYAINVKRFCDSRKYTNVFLKKDLKILLPVQEPTN